MPVLTIGITSYKRINELKRCIESIKTKYVEDIEILVSEDQSPLSVEIKEMVEDLATKIEYELRFETNEVNLGYDMNLGAIIKKSKGKYVMLMSDDDAVREGCLDEVIEFIKENDSYGVLYSPFIHDDSGRKDRNRGDENFAIYPGEENAANYLYDSILFSGLIFKRENVAKYDSSRFKNINYFQVYMFLRSIYEFGGYYFANPSVLCIEDGENAYGISESSGGNAILANRKNVKSILEFNKTLIKTIKMFDEDVGANVIKSFEKQYSLHSYSGLSIARASGRKFFKEYWKILKNLDIKIYPIARCYYIFLWIFGKKLSDKLLRPFSKRLRREK